jgi:hypothetical protein
MFSGVRFTSRLRFLHKSDRKMDGADGACTCIGCSRERGLCFLRSLRSSSLSNPRRLPTSRRRRRSSSSSSTSTAARRLRRRLLGISAPPSAPGRGPPPWGRARGRALDPVRRLESGGCGAAIAAGPFPPPPRRHSWRGVAGQD